MRADNARVARAAREDGAVVELLDRYNEAHDALCAYFRYVHDWRVFPIADCREYIWACNDSDVFYAATEKEFEQQDGNYYQASIFTYVHLTKHVFEGPEYTMILVDTQTDGNIFLMIFDNAKRRPYPEDC